jgi:hypothetical protein
MALKKTLVLIDNFNRPVEFVDAYIKIISISGGKDSMTSEIAIFESKDGKMLKSQSLRFSPDLDGSNFIRQAYISAKKTKEFEDSIDC